MSLAYQSISKITALETQIALLESILTPELQRDARSLGIASFEQMIFYFRFQLALFSEDFVCMQSLIFESEKQVSCWEPEMFDVLSDVCCRSPFYRYDLAKVCLQRHLDKEIERTEKSWEKIAILFRELVELCVDVEDSKSAFSQILQLCTTLPVSFPKVESQWIIARAWNLGVHSAK